MIIEEEFDDDGSMEEDVSDMYFEQTDDVHGDVDIEIDGRHGGGVQVVMADMPQDIHDDMEIEIAEDDEESEDGDGEHESVLYFSVSIWRGKDLYGNNDNGNSSDPYVLAKYDEHELTTRVIRNSLNPVWKSHVMFQHKENVSEIQLYVFDHEEVTSDDILGKLVVPLPNPLPLEPVFTVLDRKWMTVQPCLTSEQDELQNQQHMRRRMTKTIRIFHDDAHLFKAGSLGELQLSVTCFRLEELPKLVRERETTIDILRNKLTQQRRISSQSLTDTTLRLQTQLQALKRESSSSEQRAQKSERLLKAAEKDRDAAKKASEDEEKARKKSEEQVLRIRGEKSEASSVMDEWRAKIQRSAKLVSRAENERDQLAIKLHKLQKETANSGASTNQKALNNLSAEELQERIHALTLAYYWKKRNPHKQMNDNCREHVNKFSLPGDAPLRPEKHKITNASL